MTEQGAVPDNGIAVEPREAQRPTSLGARTPQAATPGNRDSPWVRRRASQACLKGAVAQHPRRLPALHPLVSRGKGKQEYGHPSRPKNKEQGQRSVGCITASPNEPARHPHLLTIR